MFLFPIRNGPAASRIGCSSVQIALLATAGCAGGILPDLPQVSIESFHPAVRTQVKAAYDAAEAKPRDAEADGNLGMVLQAYEMYGSAEACYRRAAKLAWFPSDWYYLLGVVQAAQGKNDEAAASFERVWWTSRSFALSYRHAECLLKAGRTEAAAKEYSKLAASSPDNPWALYGVGRARAAGGDLRGAVEEYEAACRLFPAFKAAHYALSIAYGRLGDPAGQGEELLRYGRGSAGNPPLVDALLAKVRELDRGFLYYSNQGTKFINAGLNSEAAAALEKALEIEPNHALSHIHLITAYGQLGLFDRAARHFQDAIRLEQGRADAYFT
jgi:tetratricopeptide (TPR) repeat protein